MALTTVMYIHCLLAKLVSFSSSSKCLELLLGYAFTNRKFKL